MPGIRISHRFLKFTSSFAAVLAGFAIATASAADAPLSATAAGKIIDAQSGWSAAFADPGKRVPVIVEFAMPALPDKANLATEADIDAAHIATVRAAQTAILASLWSSPAQIDGAQSSADVTLKLMDFSPQFALHATAAELEKIAADPSVVKIYEDRIDDAYLSESVPLIGMPNAYLQGATGNNFRVAVLDTGVRRTHEFLTGRVVSAACYSTTSSGSNSTSYCPGGVSSSTDIASANDCDRATIGGCGHGSHVAGIAAGFNSSLSTGEPAHGVARDARIIAINVFSRFTSGCSGTTPCVRAFTSDQISGLNRVNALRTSMNIAAANMSLGGGSFSAACDSTDSRTSIINTLRANNVAVVISAGNDGLNTQVGAPACISGAITVASSTKADARSSFSNWGTLIDVVAPGSSINSSTTSGSSNTTYSFFNGTSMAAPHVAGAWAAIRSRLPNATVTQIENALESTGVSITSSNVTRPRIRVAHALANLGVALPPPANDNFASRVAITPSTLNGGTRVVTGNNEGATKQAGEPNHAGRTTATTSVWWSFRPVNSGTVTITTVGSSFDTVLAVYTGTAVNALASVASNDDYSGISPRSRVDFPAVAGVQYQIAVAGYNAASGNITLNVTGGGGVAVNNNFASRIAITPPSTTTGSVTVTGSNGGTDKETGEPNHAGATSATTSVWWRYTPTSTGQVTIETTGSNFDTVLAVYTGSAVNALTAIASNDDIDGANNRQSRVQFYAMEGIQYQVAVAGWNANVGYINLKTTGGGGVTPPPTARLVAAVTPVARRGVVGGSAITAFATVISPVDSGAPATGCTIVRPVDGQPYAFSYAERLLPSSSLGPTNAPFTLTVGQARHFLLAFSPTAVMSSNIQLVFDCANTAAAPTSLGLNSFNLVATATAGADVLATAITPSNDGILRVPATTGGGNAAAMAGLNIGTTAALQARISSVAIGSSAAALPIGLLLCQTNPSTGACLATPTASPITFTATANELFTFAAFVNYQGTALPLDPATRRVYIHFAQGATDVGSASVAVMTTSGDAIAMKAASLD